jgi:hypothetical protein
MLLARAATLAAALSVHGCVKLLFIGSPYAATFLASFNAAFKPAQTRVASASVNELFSTVINGSRPGLRSMLAIFCSLTKMSL